MNKEKRHSEKTALTCSTRSRLLWILIVLAIIPAPMAIGVFRPWPLSPRPKGKAGLPMTEAAKAAAFGSTVPNPKPKSRAVATRDGLDSRR
jgi:hypothetical protein